MTRLGAEPADSRVGTKTKTKHTDAVLSVSELNAKYPTAIILAGDFNLKVNPAKYAEIIFVNKRQ